MRPPSLHRPLTSELQWTGFWMCSLPSSCIFVSVKVHADSGSETCNNAMFEGWLQLHNCSFKFIDYYSADIMLWFDGTRLGYVIFFFHLNQLLTNRTKNQSTRQSDVFELGYWENCVSYVLNSPISWEWTMYKPVLTLLFDSLLLVDLKMCMKFHFEYLLNPLSYLNCHCILIFVLVSTF